MGDLTDFSRLSRRLERELDGLDEHREADRDAIKRYVQSKDGDVSDGSLATYLKNLRMTSRRLDQPLTTLSEADLEAHVYDLRNSPEYGQGDEPGLSDSTIRVVEFAIRDFLDGVGAEWAEDYELTPPQQSRVRPEDMLVAEDIKALREGANNLRDIALIEFLADTGARLTLTGSLRVRDLDLEGDRATYTPNPNAKGLKGAEIREYPLIDSKATLRSYLRTVHPRPDEPDVAFFHKLPGHGNDWESEDGASSPEVVRQQLRRAAANGGVDKPVNPHNFRHSAITRMRREGYSRSQVEHRVHWEVDSDMWAIYEHIAGDEHNDDIFEAAGIADGEPGPDATRLPCGNCTEPIAPHHDFCPKCGAPASRETREAKAKAVKTVGEELATATVPDAQQFWLMFFGLLNHDARPLGHHD